MKDEFTAYLAAFVDELVSAGVQHIVVSPGSRSTPLALLATAHPRLKVWMNIDERSAGFFALGIAKASRVPVALLCTSGTAAANYFPAVAEASLSRVPLIVLTADRPHELRDVGAPQTINQVQLYGHHVKWFIDMPIPEPAPTMINHARMAAGRAVAVSSTSPSGPVHLNFPLREPLLPDLNSSSLWRSDRENGQSYITVESGRQGLDDSIVRRLASELSSLPKGLIVCGPQDEPGFAAVVTRLATALRYPILADPLSQLRSGDHSKHLVIDRYDAFLRDERIVAAFAPDVIIRFGAMPVSKPLLLFINRHSHCRHIVVDEGASWREPTLQATDMLHADPIALCDTLSTALADTMVQEGDQWSERWTQINSVTGKVLNESDLSDDLFEGRLFMELQHLLPREAVLFVGNSMPIRDCDTFYGNNSNRVRLMGNRGANGIDGLISTALGASAVDVPTVLVLGDLSFYHDMNGLLAAKLHELNVTIVIVNNDGGGIFSFLPQSEHPEYFETLFGTPTGLDFEHAVTMYGGTFVRAHSWDTFRQAFQSSITAGGLQVIEIPTDRESNVHMHRKVWQSLSEQLTPLCERERD